MGRGSGGGGGGGRIGGARGSLARTASLLMRDYARSGGSKPLFNALRDVYSQSGGRSSSTGRRIVRFLNG